MTIKPLERVYTIDDLLTLPDDGNRYELHDGEIIEVGTSSRKQTILGGWFVQMLRNYVKLQHLGGDVTSAAGTFQLDETNTRMPNAAYVSKEKVATLPRGTVYYPFAPDLAVEIKSPSNSKTEMELLAKLYIRTGARLVWTVDPEAKTVQVYRPDQTAFEISGDGELSGYDVLPSLTLSLAEMFAEVEGM